MKVLLIGHACSPTRGTEHAVTWNWGWHLAADHQVWVLTHPQERQAIERFLAEHPTRNLHFVWTALPRWRDPWDPVSGDRWIRLHYLMWQRAALRQAFRLHERIGFDVAHHVSWGTVSEPPLLSRLPVPFVWGPVGGGQVAPSAFRKYLGPSWKLERLRTVRVRLAAYRPALRETVRRSSLVLATNHETAHILKLAGARETPLFLDSGLSDQFLAKEPGARRPMCGELSFLWVGQLEPLKCLPLALEALAQLTDLPFRLVVAGKGRLRKKWEALSLRLGLGQRVLFLGHVPFEQMPSLYHSADVFLFTSIRDSFGSQLLEAMGAGLPIVALDHQGARSFVPADAGIRVPVTDPRTTVQGLARALRQLSISEEMRNRMGRISWEFARGQTWARRAAAMSRLYQDAVRGRFRVLATHEGVETPLAYRPSDHPFFM